MNLINMQVMVRSLAGPQLQLNCDINYFNSAKQSWKIRTDLRGPSIHPVHAICARLNPFLLAFNPSDSCSFGFITFAQYDICPYTFAHTTFPCMTFAHSDICPENVGPERHLHIILWPRKTIAPKDICPADICLEGRLPRRTFAQKDVCPDKHLPTRIFVHDNDRKVHNTVLS
jgi:hypothetical protein